MDPVNFEKIALSGKPHDTHLRSFLSVRWTDNTTELKVIFLPAEVNVCVFKPSRDC